MAGQAADALRELVEEGQDGEQVLAVPAGSYKGWLPRALYTFTLDALYLPFLKLLSFPVGGTALGTLNKLRRFHAVGNYLFRLPTSFADCNSLTELNLSFNHFTEIPPALYSLSGLQLLDLQDNDIEKMEPAIGRLVNLRSLNLGGNCLKDVPEELGECRHIQVLNLSGKLHPRGKLTTVPLGVCRLGELRFLDLSWQTVAEIPEQFGNLRRLRYLVLKGNHLQHVSPELGLCSKLSHLDLSGALRLCSTIPEPIFSLEDLQELSLSGNFFTEIPPEVCGLRKLRILNVQRNALLRLPDDLFALKHLEKLLLCDNYLQALEPGISKLQKLQYLDLGSNHLTSLPDELCQCRSLRTLLLNYNRLRLVPEEIYLLSGLEVLHLDNNQLTELPLLLDRMEGLGKTGQLYLYNNQLRKPPQQICDQGVVPLFHFLKDLRTSEAKHRRKMILIGAVKAGKTSLRNALMLGASKLTEEHERTWVLERHLWEPESKLRVQILDFGGHHIYSAAHHMFLTPEALHVLVFDVSKYQPEDYDSLVGNWLDAILDRAPGATIMIVGTHADLVSKEDVAERTEDLLARLHREEKEKKLELQTEIERIQKVLEKPEAKESGGKFGDIGIERLTEKLQRMQRMLNTRSILPESVMVVSCAENLEGLDYLRAALVQTLKDSEEKPLPESWWKFLQALQLREERILQWDGAIAIFSQVMEAQHKSMISLAGSPELSLEMVLKYLHNTGEIVWYHDNPKLRNIVFHRPETLVEMLRAVFRHDFEHVVQFDDGLGRTASLSRNRFQGMKEDFMRNGLMTYELLLYVLLQFALSTESMDTFISLMLKFDLCYEVNDVTSPVLAGSQRILQFPWFFPAETPKSLATRWQERIPSSTFQLSYELRFASKGPPNFFEKLSVRLASLVTNRLNWKDGVLAERNNSTLLIHRRRGEDETTVTVTTRGSDLQELWYLVVATRKDMLTLLQEWPFIRFEINFVCPHCMLRGLASPYLFVGDVLETQPPKNLYWASGWCKREEEEKIPVCFVYPLDAEFQDGIEKHIAAATEFLGRLCDKPDGAGNALLSDVGLADVASHLGVEWTYVMLKLGLTQAQIEQTQMDFPSNTFRCIHTALLQWRDNQPDGREEKIAKLLEVLESDDIGKRGLTENLRERYNIGDYASTNDVDT